MGISHGNVVIKHTLGTKHFTPSSKLDTCLHDWRSSRTWLH